jgi:hypothetical protein
MKSETIRMWSNFQHADSVQGFRQTILDFRVESFLETLAILPATNILHEYAVAFVERYNACIPSEWK